MQGVNRKYSGTRTQSTAYSSQSLQVMSRSGGGLKMTGQEQRLTAQVGKMHSPDGPQLNNVRSLFNHAKLLFRDAGYYDGDVDATCMLENRLDVNLTQMIERVLGEIGCKCPGAGSDADVQSSTLAVVRVLQRCEWEEMIVITLATLAVKLGEFKLMSKMYSGDSLADSIALLKQLPGTSTTDSNDTLTAVIAVMIQVTEKVVSFTHHLNTSQSLSFDNPSVDDVCATFPVTACWIIMSTVTAATHVSMSASSLSSSTLQLSKCLETLKLVHQDLDRKTEFVVAKLMKVAYKKLRADFFEFVKQDIKIAIKTLICSTDDALPLHIDSENNKVQLDVLQGKTVLLLLTDQSHNLPELDMLESIYEALTRKNCVIVWVQVIERSSSTATATATTITWSSSSTGKQRPWYCVSNSLTISQEAIMFFKQDLNFNGRPTLVCMDSTRQYFSSMNVLHMLRIWKEEAFPFTKSKAEELWKKNIYLTLDLLVANMAIEGFKIATNTAYECVYVGKSCMETNKMSSVDKSFGHVMEEKSMRVFWTRLESMLYANMELEEYEDDDDVMVEIKKIISYDKSKSSWAVIFKGNKVIKVVSGTTILEVLNCDSWEKKMEEHGGVESALRFQIDNGTRESEHHCIRLEFPIAAAGKIPLTMKCPGCREPMVALTVFVCCRDVDVPVAVGDAAPPPPPMNGNGNTNYLLTEEVNIYTESNETQNSG
ncbi:hypothetical protein V2J09_001630 [Rumex salicifolius]